MKNPTVDFVNTLNRAGASTMRLRLTAEEVRQLRAAEKRGHDEAVRLLLELLRTRRQP